MTWRGNHVWLLRRFLQLVDDDPDSVPWAGPLFDEELVRVSPQS